MLFSGGGCAYYAIPVEDIWESIEKNGRNMLYFDSIDCTKYPLYSKKFESPRPKSNPDEESSDSISNPGCKLYTKDMETFYNYIDSEYGWELGDERVYAKWKDENGYKLRVLQRIDLNGRKYQKITYVVPSYVYDKYNIGDLYKSNNDK